MPFTDNKHICLLVHLFVRVCGCGAETATETEKNETLIPHSPATPYLILVHRWGLTGLYQPQTHGWMNSHDTDAFAKPKQESITVIIETIRKSYFMRIRQRP